MPDTLDHEIAHDLRDVALGHPILGDAPREHACDHECPGMERCAVCAEVQPEPARYVEPEPLSPAARYGQEDRRAVTVAGAIVGAIIGALLAWAVWA